MARGRRKNSDILERYLNSLHDSPEEPAFRARVHRCVRWIRSPINIGDLRPSSEFDSDSFVTGSTERALRVVDRPFDQLRLRGEAGRQLRQAGRTQESASGSIDRRRTRRCEHVSSTGLTKHSFLSGPATQTYGRLERRAVRGPLRNRTRMGHGLSISQKSDDSTCELLFPVGVDRQNAPAIRASRRGRAASDVDKDYILVMNMFLKYISDLWDEHVETYRHTLLAATRPESAAASTTSASFSPKAPVSGRLYEQRIRAEPRRTDQHRAGRHRGQEPRELEGVFRNIDFRFGGQSRPDQGLAARRLKEPRSRTSPSPPSTCGRPW